LVMSAGEAPYAVFGLAPPGDRLVAFEPALGAARPEGAAEGPPFRSFEKPGLGGWFTPGRRQQAPCVRVGRSLEDPLRRPRFEHFAPVEHDHPIGHGLGHDGIVGDPQPAEPSMALKLRQEGQEFGLQVGIQGRGWLVQHQQFRIAGQGDGQGDSLALATAEFPGQPSEKGRCLRELQPRQQRGQSIKGGSPGLVHVNPGEECELGIEAQDGIEGPQGVLRHPAQATPPNAVPGRTGAIQGHAEGLQGAFGLDHARGQHPEDGLGQQALPRSRLAQKGDAFARVQGKGEGGNQAHPIPAAQAQAIDKKGHRKSSLAALGGGSLPLTGENPGVPFFQIEALTQCNAHFGGCMDFLKPDVQERLSKDHFEFRKLMEEHTAADQRLQCLVNKVRLTSQESLEEAALKKAKLRAKERIYQIVLEDSKHRSQ